MTSFGAALFICGIGAMAGGFLVFKFMDFVSTEALSKLSASCANLNDQITHWKARAAKLEEIEEAQNREETPEQWREKNLKTKYEQIEHDIRASEVAYQRHIDKLTRLKKIRDEAIQEYPDLQDDIEIGFEIYRRKDNTEGSDELPKEEERY